MIYVFLTLFLVAGFTGMWLSHVSLNVSMHDSFYVIAHFHIMLSGAAMTAIFPDFIIILMLYLVLNILEYLDLCI